MSSPGPVVVRPMRDDDVEVAERISDDAFAATDGRRRTPEHSASWTARTRHLATEAGGCWVAEDADGTVVGFATSLRRDGTWILATYAVRPGLQGRGLGRQLLDAALEHSRGCLRGMLASSADPKAVRRYLLAGFTMHPQMHLTGTVDRSAIPPVDRVREGSLADVDLCDSVDRATRGAGHGPGDHAVLAADGRLLVCESTTGSGYAYLRPTGQLALLAATDRRTATRLLWTVLAEGPAEQTVPHLTAANAWAIDVGTAARLDLGQSGYLGLRGMTPPAPYIHHGALL